MNVPGQTFLADVRSFCYSRVNTPSGCRSNGKGMEYPTSHTSRSKFCILRFKMFS